MSEPIKSADHVDPGPVVMLPKGDPVYSVWVWRQDSITLARLRPFIEEIVVLADAPCEKHHVGTCLERPAVDPAKDYCWPCRLKQLRARMYGYRTPKEPS